MSRALTPFFQSHHEGLGAVRDLALGALCYFPPTRRLMLSTLAGVAQGLEGMLPLEPISAFIARQ